MKKQLSSKHAIETCTISTADGVSLHARIFRPTHESTIHKDDDHDDNNNSTTASTSASASSSVVVVLVHPYSKLGGSKAIMDGIALRLYVKGCTAITFDMRGAGRSTGKSTLTGVVEIQDVVAVCKWVSSNFPDTKILLLGSSAGAAIAGSAVDLLEEVVGYVGIGYPFGLAASFIFWRHHKAILQSPKPKLFIMGTNDGITSVTQMVNKLKVAAGRVETHLIKGISHFDMEGPEHDARMADLILSFRSRLLENNSASADDHLLQETKQHQT